MSARRVAVTGVGMITPLSDTTESTWEGLQKGQSGIDYIESFDTEEFKVHFGGEANDFDPSERLDHRRLKRMDRFVKMGLATAIQAMDHADLTEEDVNGERAGVVTGSGIGGLEEIETQHQRLFDRGPNRVSPFFIPKMMMNAAPGQISMEFGFEGPNYSTVSACSSANHALGAALNHIRNDEADIMISGGIEACFTPSCLAGFSALRALSTRNEEPRAASRPFDEDRDGFVLSEASGLLVLESFDHAQERGAQIFAEVKGFGSSADAHHITAPEPSGEGATKAMEHALSDAGCSPDRVSYVNAHGTSTEKNDPIETRAIKNVLGDHAYDIPVTSTKSMLGHSLGAAAGVEAVVTVLSIRDQTIHPTKNLENPDPECDLDYVPEEARNVEIDLALSNSFGFGGHNSCLAIQSV